MAAHAFGLQNGNDLRRVRDRLGPFVRDETSIHRFGIDFDGFSGEKCAERVRELLVQRAAIENFHCSRIDGQCLASSLDLQQASHGLHVIFQNRNRSNLKLLHLFSDALPVILQVGVDHPEDHSLRRDLRPNRAQFWNALPGQRATIAGEEQNDYAPVRAAKLVIFAAIIQKAEVRYFLHVRECDAQ